LFNENYKRNMEKVVKRRQADNSPTFLEKSPNSPLKQPGNTVLGDYFSHDFPSLTTAQFDEWLQGTCDQQTVLFLLFQELIRLVSGKQKELGYLLMLLFKRYNEESERKWQSVMKGLKEYIDKLKNEREYLLCKFNYSAQMNLKETLENKELTEENLIEHKTLIEKIIGEFYDIEDRHFTENYKRKYFEKEVYDTMWEWDKLRVSKHLKD